MRSSLLSGLFAMALFGWAMPASAVVYGGVDFPDGAASFADELVGFTLGSPPSTHPTHTDHTDALGPPDYSNPTGAVSLGRGGSITVRFTDNSLNGSGDSTDDLWIFEIGPDVEDTFVELSTDGLSWVSVGKVGGSISGVDIDAFGFGLLDFFSYVRLTDDPNEGNNSGSTVGADIDAIGAISSAPPVDDPVIPEPATLALMSLGLGGLGAMRRRNSKA